MLVAYSLAYQKIAMGLLSYLPDLTSMDLLSQALQHYQESDVDSLWLWKDEDTENLVAIIGLEVLEHSLLVKQMAILPGFRGEKLSYAILDACQEKWNRPLNATLELSELILKWKQDRQEDIHV